MGRCMAKLNMALTPAPAGELEADKVNEAPSAPGAREQRDATASELASGRASTDALATPPTSGDTQINFFFFNIILVIPFSPAECGD